ncbi:hypothetical protein AVEN_150707-1 [Araneus ventricosus]|uniref:Uncharacterized protein n=1 Tax=Araneus ventricosus TaxID=182803 RepID=A0A4Y2PFX2_ARAVE|nr:hypothetical protein AVEN_150707-1 [Araneus ventricosus]
MKFGLMKQFIKSSPKDGECFGYLYSKFPNLSEAKLKEGVFTGPTNENSYPNENCYPISSIQKQWWTEEKKSGTLKDVVHRFLGILKTLSTKPCATHVDSV